MKTTPKLLITTLALALSIPLSALSQEDEVQKVDDAITVLNEVMEIEESSIPRALLQEAHAIAVIPNVISAGLVVGGRHGTGILVEKRNDGTWSDPVFISLTGGSVGWQIGAQSTDVILIFRTARSLESLLKSKFTLGANAGVSAGPVGRNASASTDVNLKSEILSYSRSRGIFAGVSLEGSSVEISRSKNSSFYNKKNISVEDIFAGRITNTPEVAKDLRRTLDEYSRKQ